MLDSFPRNLNCFPNSTWNARFPKRRRISRGKQPYIDRYLINYESRAQSPVAGCISAVIVSHSRKLLRRLTQFRILSLISIEDQHLAVRKGRLARSITRAEPIPLAGCSSIPVMVPSPTILPLFLPPPICLYCIYVYVPVLL